MCPVDLRVYEGFSAVVLRNVLLDDIVDDEVRGTSEEALDRTRRGVVLYEGVGKETAVVGEDDDDVNKLLSEAVLPMVA